MSDDDDWDGWGEEQVHFAGCTCDHEEGQHGWGSCDVEGCPCEDGWEE